MSNENHHIVVIGAGIIGICCTAVLRRRGLRVTLIERDEPCGAASRGNAGAIATAEVLPLASPGIMAKAPKWLLDPLGPLSIRPAYLPQLMPWLYRFWRASSHTQVRQSAHAIAALMAHCMPATQRVFDDAGIAHCLRALGALHVYNSTAAFTRARWEWALRGELGVRFEPLDTLELAEMAPELGTAFAHAMYLPDWVQVSDPYTVGRDIAHNAVRNGVELVRGDVAALSESDGAPVVALRDGRSLAADQVVIAAGAWSHRLCAQWGEHIPLETERGYNTTLPHSGVELSRHITFAEHGFVASPLSCGLRIGGAVELGGLEAPPNYERANLMLNKAKGFIRGVDTREATQWMGFRPSLPDSLPVIGRSAKRDGIIHAFGHGHLGLTQAAATAELVADLVLETPPAVDLRPFRADRF